jgi:hypothetical protein
MVSNLYQQLHYVPYQLKLTHHKIYVVETIDLYTHLDH